MSLASNSPAGAAASTSNDPVHAAIAAGRLADALSALQQQVRTRPDDARLRVLLFQLLALTGQWPRAGQQLELCGELDAAALAMVGTYRPALQAELVREAVFAGRTTPVVLGRPEAWVALLVQALRADADGQADAARTLRDQALEQAPAVGGTIDGQPFAWLADADSRLGPVLEAVVNGRYVWVPFAALAAVRIEPPADLRDLAWSAAHLTFVHGGETVALLFTRYPGSATWDDDRIRLARRTEWLPLAEPHAAGIGQRMFATDAGDHPLLEVRAIAFDVAPVVADDASGTVATA